jgi:hypothetical protein
MSTPPPGFPIPTTPLSAVPDLSVSAQTWSQEAKDKFLDDLQAVQITDPKLPRSVVHRLMKYSGEYPTCLLLYTPTGVTIEQIDRDKEENEDLVATINRVAVIALVVRALLMTISTLRLDSLIEMTFNSLGILYEKGGNY